MFCRAHGFFKVAKKQNKNKNEWQTSKNCNACRRKRCGVRTNSSVFFLILRLKFSKFGRLHQKGTNMRETHAAYGK